MNLTALSLQLEEANARIEQIVFIGGMVSDGDSPADPLREFLEEVSEKDFRACFPDAPDVLYEAMEDGDIVTGFIEWAMDFGKLGFLIEFATPVTRPCAAGRQYSWGHYYTHWVYAETIEAAIEAGLAWVAERRQAEDAKARESATGKLAT